MRSVLRQLAMALALFWVVLTLTWMLIRVAPGDPVSFLAPPAASAADLARLRASLDLDAPLVVQYGRWAREIFKGDLGTSFVAHRPVTSVLREAVPISLALGGISLMLTFVLGVFVGGVQGARRGSRLDSALTLATTTVYAAPSFWLALSLIALFTYGAARLGLPMWMRLPAFGVRDPAGTSGVAELVRHAVLPVLTLTLIGAAGIARYARTSAVELLQLQWVRTAIAKGVPTRAVHARHVLANALPTLLILFALALPGVLAGSVFVETVFGWPGVGRLMVSSIFARDYPVVVGATVVYSATVIFANLAADLALPLVDPRRRT
ncbi:MAG TPA: ABC transporter permease [Gemmatimonadaceae bacterium]|jgi:peptide/nickel transport system permease protein|nr:ABC transporter permease [Gemmatimonadaceae bacterium]